MFDQCDEDGWLFFVEPQDDEWTDEDEARLEEFEESRRRRIAEANEY